MSSSRSSPDARVVYIDNDPMVETQSRTLLDGAGATTVIRGDLREPETILGNPDLRRLIDFSQPAGVLMTAVLMFVSDSADPWDLVAQYMEAMAPGSYLSLSHLTDERKPPLTVERFRAVFDRASERMHFRSHADIARFFEGLDLVPPYEGRPRPHLHRHLGCGRPGTRGQRGAALALLRGCQAAVIAKPTVDDLGIDPDAQEWQRSGDGAGAIEIAFSARAAASPRSRCFPGVRCFWAVLRRASVPGASADQCARRGGVPGGASVPEGGSVPEGPVLGAGSGAGDADWILMRVTDDPDRRVLVFDRNEWESFLDGARKGEFDDAAGHAAPLDCPDASPVA